MPNVSDSQILAIALAGGFFLLGGVVILQSLSAIARGAASRRWPKAGGTIVESRVEEQVNADGQLVFSPQVRYRYIVQGNEYELTTITFPTRAFTSCRWAKAVVAKYPVNSSVLVAYLPEKSTISVLEPGLTGSAFVGFSFGLGFLLSSVVGCYYFFLV